MMHRKLLFSKDEIFVVGLEGMADDILHHAQHAMGNGYRIQSMKWDYRLVNGPVANTHIIVPVANMHVIAPDGTSYSADVRHTDDGWVLDPRAEWIPIA